MTTDQDIYKEFLEFQQAIDAVFDGFLDNLVDARVFSDKVQPVIDEYRQRLEVLYPDTQENADIERGDYTAPWTHCQYEGVLDDLTELVDVSRMKEGEQWKSVVSSYRSIVDDEGKGSVRRATEVSPPVAKEYYERHCQQPVRFFGSIDPDAYRQKTEEVIPSAAPFALLPKQGF